MTTPPDGSNKDQQDIPDSIGELAGQRGTDERRQAVDPAQNPAPRSPGQDRDAVKKGEEILERVKPY